MKGVKQVLFSMCWTLICGCWNRQMHHLVDSICTIYICNNVKMVLIATCVLDIFIVEVYLLLYVIGGWFIHCRGSWHVLKRYKIAFQYVLLEIWKQKCRDFVLNLLVCRYSFLKAVSNQKWFYSFMEYQQSWIQGHIDMPSNFLPDQERITSSTK